MIVCLGCFEQTFEPRNPKNTDTKTCFGRCIAAGRVKNDYI